MKIGGTRLIRNKKITSIKDSKIIEARSLLSTAGRKKSQKMLLLGIECIKWGYKAQLNIEHVFVTNDIVEDVSIPTWLLEKKIPCYEVSKGISQKISQTSYLIPCIGVAQIPKKNSRCITGDVVVVLDNVKDHGNIGTIIRTAVAFGVTDIITVNSTEDIYYKNIVYASRGNVFNINYRQFVSSDCVKMLKQTGYQVITTSPHAKINLSEVDFPPQPLAIVFGNETNGISDSVNEEADFNIKIPLGKVESLNIGVAAGIIMYDLKRKLLFKTASK